MPCGKTFRRKPKTFYKVSLFISLTIIIELLQKEKNERITIKDCLDHPWFVGGNHAISKLRKDAMKDKNEIAQFISYSIVDANLAA